MARSSRHITACSGLAMVAAGVALVLPTGVASAAAPQPVYATATVDGDPGEWTADAGWGSLISNDPPHRVVGSLFLRYDCAAETLFALIAAGPEETFKTEDAAEAYLRLGPGGKLVSGLSGNDGVPPDFAWVGPSGITAAGFESSVSLAPGSYPASLRVHAKLPDDSADGYETIDLEPRYQDLMIECPITPPTTSETVPESVAPTTVAPTTVAPTTVASTVTSPPEATVLQATTNPIKARVADPKLRDPAVQKSQLARTGSSTGPLGAVGSILLVLGWALVLRARQLRLLTKPS